VTGWVLTICGIIWAIWGIGQLCAGIITGLDGGSRAHGGSVLMPLLGGLVVTAIAAGALWMGQRMRHG
jgi:hypothetical protein